MSVALGDGSDPERLSAAFLEAELVRARRGIYTPPLYVAALIEELTKLRGEASRRGPCAACPFAGCDCQWQGGK